MNFQDVLAMSYELDGLSIKESSAKMYKSSIRSYSKFFNELFPDVVAFPPTEETIRVFIKYQFDAKKKCFNTLQNYIAGLRHWFAENDVPDPTKNPSFKKFYHGLRNEMRAACPPHRKEPVLPEELEKFASMVNKENKEDVLVMSMFSLMFFGFLRISEVYNLMNEDVTFINDEIISVRIRSSKTDKLGKSATIFIRKGEKIYDCYSWMELYYEKSPVQMKLFPISMHSIRHQISHLYSCLGKDESKYSGHSFRRGGAHAAALAGAGDCFIQKHGRWTSDCYTQYTAIEMNQAGNAVTIVL